MKNGQKFIFGIGILSVFFFAAFKMVGNGWKIDVANSKIVFTMPNGKHDGTVTGLDATFNFDPAHPELATIRGSIDLKNLKADNDHLTEHLMTPDFFDAANHPKISFTADQVTKSDSGFVATGKLAMRDSIHTVKIPFRFIQNGKSATINGVLDIFAGDYGVGKKSAAGNDRVVITIEVPVTQE